MDLMLTEKADYRVQRASGAAPEKERMLAPTKARSRMGATEPTVEIVTDEAGFLALEPEWESLRAQLSEPRFSQSFVWARCGWETTARPRGRDLFILIMRVEGRAVLIWPLTIRKKHGLWKVAAPLGPEWTEYDPGLFAPSPQTVSHVRAAWEFLRRNCPADLIIVPHCREGEPMHEAIQSDPTPRAVTTLPSPFASLGGFPDWPSYWKTRSRKTKDNVGRRSRRFAEQGEVTFGLIEDAAEFESLLAWALARKREWMARTGRDNDFMAAREFPEFLREIAAVGASREALVMFALKLDGRVVVVKIGTRDDFRVEGFIEAQDRTFAEHSVGSIAQLECLKWCQARGLAYDFRIGDEDYKRMWATNDRPATTYQLAIKPWGRQLLRLSAAHENARIAKDRVRTSIPSEFRRKVKQKIGGWLSRARALPARTESFER
jgi:CelD/BcsL family acetyltransferase involved in cellulose biosynthesis